MGLVRIGVSSLEASLDRFEKAWNTGTYQGEFISFVSMELLWKTLTPRRFDLIGKMAGKGPMSLRAVARLVGKDVKTTHEDVHALLRHGILEKSADGKIVFPYDGIRVEFTLPVPAAA
jgi:predicted transcriptional regulator